MPSTSVATARLGIRRSACALAFEALPDGAFTAIVSPYILEELRAVLALPNLRASYSLTDDHVAVLLYAYGRQAEAVAGILVLPKNGDPLAGARGLPQRAFQSYRPRSRVEPDYLVSDDAGFLDLKNYRYRGTARCR